MEVLGANTGTGWFPASSFAHIDPGWGAAVIPISLGTGLSSEEGRFPQRTPGSKSNPNKAGGITGKMLGKVNNESHDYVSVGLFVCLMEAIS